jgi:hypothetical protein
MNIFAVVKKCINSNLDKPLNETIEEIKKSTVKGTRIVESAVGVLYNTTYSSQVLSMNDEPIFSVNGRGRILQIIPVSNKNVTSNVYGTTILTVDDKTLLNNSVEFASTANSYAGKCIVDTEKRENTLISVNVFGEDKYCNIVSPNIRLGDVTSFIANRIGIINPNGVSFERGFEIRLSQMVSNTPNDYGVIVVYELYE